MINRGFLFLGLIMLLACSGSTSSAPLSSQSTMIHPLNVVATTGMVADAIRRVGGEHVTVTTLMGPGVDPHLYKASQNDIERLSQADIIFYNGLNLEGKMGDIFVKMARTRPVVAVTESIDPKLLREPPEFAGHFDPHVWFDVELWSSILHEVEKSLAKSDPNHASLFQANRATYESELMVLHSWVKKELASIPKQERVLITAHDAFGYFGHAYDTEVVGLQGMSTVSEYGLNDVQRIVDLLVTRKIKAVFVESSIPKRSIEAVVEGAKGRGHSVMIGGQLYSDAMGAEGTPEGTYVGMVTANVNTIVRALRGDDAAPTVGSDK